MSTANQKYTFYEPSIFRVNSVTQGVDSVSITLYRDAILPDIMAEQKLRAEIKNATSVLYSNKILTTHNKRVEISTTSNPMQTPQIGPTNIVTLNNANPGGSGGPNGPGGPGGSAGSCRLGPSNRSLIQHLTPRRWSYKDGSVLIIHFKDNTNVEVVTTSAVWNSDSWDEFKNKLLETLDKVRDTRDLEEKQLVGGFTNQCSVIGRLDLLPEEFLKLKQSYTDIGTKLPGENDQTVFAGEPVMIESEPNESQV